MTEKQQEEIDLLKELIADSSIAKDEREIYQKALTTLLSQSGSEEPKVAKKMMPKKEKATPKTKATKKPKATKPAQLPSDVEAMKKQIKERTGKTESECEDIIAQYRMLRNKAKVNGAKRIAKLKNSDDLIAGTNVITPVAQIEKDAEIVKAKIEKQVEQIENKAERQVVTKDKTKDEVKVAVEKKVIKELAKLSDDMVLKSTTFVKNIQTELKKVDKTEAKNFLLGLRNEIDALLSKFGDGGTTQIYNIAEMNSSSSSVNPSKFARGGGLSFEGNSLSDYELEKIKSGVSIKEMDEILSKKFPDSFGFELHNIKDSRYLTPDYDSLEYKIKNESLKISIDSHHSMHFTIYQGGENTYFDFLVTGSDGLGYIGSFGFKDEGNVPKEYITSFTALLMQFYGYSFKVNHEVYARGGGVNANNNDVRVKALIKSLDNTPNSIGLAILRERLLTYTLNDLEVMKENPNAFGNFFISAGMYEDYFNRVFEELKFEYENGGEVGEFAMGGRVDKDISWDITIRDEYDNETFEINVRGYFENEEDAIKQAIKDYDIYIDESDYGKMYWNGNEITIYGAKKNYKTGGGLIGNQKRIDLNENGKIDAEDFKLLRSSMNGAWRNEHKHVNSTSRNKQGKLDKSEVRYAKKNNPSRTGYNGKTNYAMGGMLKPRLKKGDDVLIIGRRWFDKVNGNTYHTAELQVNGNFVAKSGMQYGYGDNYVETGKELLLQNYKLPIGFNEKSPLYQLRDKKITFRSFAYDGLKRDLAKGGGIDGVPQDIKERLEYLRGEIRNESISYEELIELQSLAQYIEPNDVELLEPAGVSEFEDEYVSSCNVCGNDMNSSEMSDMDNVCKSCNYAKGGKVGEFKNIMENNIITEKEVNLIKMRMNNNRVDETTQEVIDYIWDNSPELTPDQNKKGIDYLRNLWKSPTGKERTNNPFGYREQETLDTFEYFELRGFYDAGNYNNKFYVPLYNCVGADSSFEYAFYGGKVNILG